MESEGSLPHSQAPATCPYHVCMYVSMCEFIYVCMHMCVYVCHVWMYVCMDVYICCVGYVHMCTCVQISVAMRSKA
jgi:hypothetical protein